MVRPDGAVRHLQAWTDVERDADGAVVKVDRRHHRRDRARAAARSPSRQSRASLAAALELTRTATWEWDVAADRLTWSDRMFELMGIDPGVTPTLADFLGALHPDDREWINSLNDRTVATGRVGGDAVPGRAPGRIGAPHPRLDRRTPGTGRHGHATCGAPRWTSPSRRSQPRG